MSVVTGSAAGRWVVAGSVAVCVAVLPGAVDRLPVGRSERDPRQVVAAARHSAGVPHQGLVEVVGALGLPDLPRLGDLAALLGGTTRARVWWRSPGAWRVDRVSATGETGTYAVPGGVQSWDFESHRARVVIQATPVRLPRLDDLLPPQAARRVLAAVTGADRLVALPPRRIAGRAADGVRVLPHDTASTVGRLDLYVDRATGLPLSLVVAARDSGQVALRTTFLDVSLRAPDRSVVQPHLPPATPVQTTVVPDLATAVDMFAPYRLPDVLAGARRATDPRAYGGTATYGVGLARFVVLPLTPDLGQSAVQAARDAGSAAVDVGGGADAVAVTTPLLDAVLVRAAGDAHGPVARGGRAYLLAGTVDVATLQAAARQLVADPPPRQ